MPHIDLYAIYALDRHQSPEVLVGELTAQLNTVDPRDTLTRNRIDTAKAILGDRQRRARYDAQLADPNAPSIDEVTLATIAGRSVPTAPRTGLAGTFAETKARVLAGIVGVLALVLVISITAVSCSGEDSNGDVVAAETHASTQSGKFSNEPSAEKPSSECTPTQVDYLNNYEHTRPDTTLVLERQTRLPSEITAQSDSGSGTSLPKITPYQDKNVGVGATNAKAKQFWIAVFSPDTKLVSTTPYSDLRDVPKSFDLATAPGKGYFRISANGVTIPQAAAGTQPDQHYATVLIDAFDRSTVWVLLRGGDSLYKATAYLNESEETCTGK